MSIEPQSPVSPIIGAHSPSANFRGDFLIPSPLPTKRSRTYSQSEQAAAGPSFRGIVKNFCREKGHGFINPSDSTEQLFVHISDIDGDYIPKAGDTVSYKKCLIPPKNEKVSAVHVQIMRPVEGVKHETWDAPITHDDT